MSSSNKNSYNRRGSTDLNRRGSMDNKHTTTTSNRQQQLPSRNSCRDSMRSSISNSSNEPLIDGALAIMRSPQPAGSPNKPRVTRRRGSLITARQANELLLDTSDCLSEMMQKRRQTGSTLDGDCDSGDSDIEL
ncbi:unnamed protein product [Cylindrotheca closterium]|uniref:Uncharacterized protein n=1 Tax=Cylindrotheca closterium TaxID=2856 RepID=A0AAD2PY55_9STRA|nr:unnamed protein product [Cylindrotheca closterium]